MPTLLTLTVATLIVVVLVGLLEAPSQLLVFRLQALLTLLVTLQPLLEAFFAAIAMVAIVVFAVTMLMLRRVVLFWVHDALLFVDVG
jgi:hypothetical protein